MKEENLLLYTAKKIDDIVELTSYCKNQDLFIKVDVQGYELMVFQGMENLIKISNSVYIISEFESGLMKKAGYTPDKFLEYIESLGLKWQLINEKKKELTSLLKKELIELSEKTQTLNILITK